MTALFRLNSTVDTPEPWTQDGEYYRATWGESPLATTLSIHAPPKSDLYVSIFIGPFKGHADAEAWDEIPRALRLAYAQAIRSAGGTDSEPLIFKDVALAPRGLQAGLRRALDEEVRAARLEVKRLDYAKGQAEYAHERAVASRALLPEVI